MSQLNERSEQDSFIEPTQKNVTYKEFIDKELVHFSFADNKRSIPNVIDGLKPCKMIAIFVLSVHR